MVVTQMHIISVVMFRLQFQWSVYSMYTLISEIPMFFQFIKHRVACGWLIVYGEDFD